MNPYSGGAQNAAKGALKGTSTFVREDELSARKAARPFPPKARKMYWFMFVPLVLFGAGLPLILEATGVGVHVGPWLALTISIPGTILAMFAVSFLREGFKGNLVFSSVILFVLQLAYALEFGPEDTQRALMMRVAPLVVAAILIFFMWIDLKKNLREWHYRIASGESWQDILTQYQQASVIRKAGGKPALDAEGNVVDAEEMMPRPGFRQKPKKRDPTQKKKRQKPRLR
ncbi:MAG: hypothetical protein IT462_05015 [Planctomycetes bacterium]|nr:hypothetical protein [Planctomycetota bacterium]